MRHGVYYAPKVVPCECGSHEAYWHGPEDGERTYCCDACWKRQKRAAAATACARAGTRLPRGTVRVRF